jgi:hypothetical protein
LPERFLYNDPLDLVQVIAHLELAGFLAGINHSSGQKQRRRQKNSRKLLILTSWKASLLVLASDKPVGKLAVAGWAECKYSR